MGGSYNQMISKLKIIIVDDMLSADRVMYWTDWGRTAKIEVASMDGSERRDFVITDLSQPNGIAIDLSENRVYWSDADLDKLEFINFDGSSRTSVETAATGLTHPFAVSVGNNALFWSDWATNSIYATHKEHGANSIDGNGYFATIASFPSTPYGVEALLPGRQPAGNVKPHLSYLDTLRTHNNIIINSYDTLEYNYNEY